MLLLTAQEGLLCSTAVSLTPPRRAAPQIAARIAVVCLGVDAGARHGVKTGENAAPLNRR